MRLAAALLSITITASGARADGDPRPWRLSAYGGIATRLSTSDIFLRGRFHPDDTQVGLSLDRDLADIGSGFTLVGEAGTTRFVKKSTETTAELGLGVRYDFQFLGGPVSLGGFTGPSFATGEPVIPTGTFHGTAINFRKVPWLNYVGAEISVGLADRWSGVLRYYHRSGAFGLFEPNADEGSTLGAGIQYRF